MVEAKVRSAQPGGRTDVPVLVLPRLGPLLELRPSGGSSIGNRRGAMAADSREEKG